MPSVVVSDSATPIFPAGIQGSQILVNYSSTITIWLDPNTNVGVNNGLPLSPGSSMVWPEQTSLYAAVGDGPEAVLYYMPGSSAINVGSVMSVTGSVDINSPVTLTPGTSVGLAAGTAVTLADGSQVTLSNGTSVALAQGTNTIGGAYALSDPNPSSIFNGSTVLSGPWTGSATGSGASALTINGAPAWGTTSTVSTANSGLATFPIYIGGLGGTHNSVTFTGSFAMRIRPTSVWGRANPYVFIGFANAQSTSAMQTAGIMFSAESTTGQKLWLGQGINGGAGSPYTVGPFTYPSGGSSGTDTIFQFIGNITWNRSTNTVIISGTMVISNTDSTNSTTYITNTYNIPATSYPFTGALTGLSMLANPGAQPVATGFFTQNFTVSYQ